MKKLFFFLIANLTFAQTNETLNDLKISEIKMDEISNKEKGMSEIQNELFKSFKYETNSQKQVDRIDLYFTKDKVLLKNKSEIIDILKKNFGEPYASFSNTYMFRKNLEKAIANIDYVGGIKYSSISFFKYEPEISEKVDEFTGNKYTSINSSGYDEVFVNYNDYYRIGFKGMESKESKGIFMIINTKNDEWKFIENLIFLNDGQTNEIAIRSDRDITKDGKTSEKLAVQLPEELIQKIINSKSSKLRISGKANDDLTLTTFVIETLRRLNNYMYK
ncbi:hypothetical protein [Daejeonia sp. YH14]|uniref:hypothetical protein n=1 Tax=Daejeonia sp. YH14 TaxID=3439042 RepID=UPI003F49B206